MFSVCFLAGCGFTGSLLISL
ncbi:lipoprotein [Campylobacter sp.]